MDEIKFITKHLKRKQKLKKVFKVVSDFWGIIYFIFVIHCVAIFSIAVGWYLLYRFWISNDYIFFFLCLIIGMMGIALDNRKQYMTI